jgi:6-pyruvoyltetrahydropterin/6-carboxytetrahydropterin synthase
MKIGTTLYIDAAHQLPNHSGKCKNLHGHTYKIIVTVYGEPNPKTGMLIDFGEIKKIANMLDHQNISEVPPFNGEGHPATAENIAHGLSTNLLMNGLVLNENLKKVVVRVYEGHNNWAESEATAIKPGQGKPSKYLVPVWMCVKSTDGKMTLTDDWEIWIDGGCVQRMTDPDGRPFYGGREPLRVMCFRTKEEMEEWRGQA